MHKYNTQNLREVNRWIFVAFVKVLQSSYGVLYEEIWCPFFFFYTYQKKKKKKYGSSEARVRTSWWLRNRNWPIVQANKHSMPSVRGSF